MVLESVSYHLLYCRDDGHIPNSNLPVILYEQAFDKKSCDPDYIEQVFAARKWSGAWRNGIYNFHHYHSNSHEVLAIYAGQAKLQLGGPSGPLVDVVAGDVLILPAGTGHKNVEEDGLKVLGAYPGGKAPDLLKGEPGERPAVDRAIAAVAIPAYDPLLGRGKGLCLCWRTEQRPVNGQQQDSETLV